MYVRRVTRSGCTAAGRLQNTSHIVRTHTPQHTHQFGSQVLRRAHPRSCCGEIACKPLSNGSRCICGKGMNQMLGQPRRARLTETNMHDHGVEGLALDLVNRGRPNKVLGERPGHGTVCDGSGVQKASLLCRGGGGGHAPWEAAPWGRTDSAAHEVSEGRGECRPVNVILWLNPCHGFAVLSTSTSTSRDGR